MSFIFNLLIAVFFVSSSTLAMPAAKPGSLLVKRKSSAEVSTLSAVHVKAGAISIKRFTYPAGLELVQVKAGTSTEEALHIYQEDPSIEYAEPNYIVHIMALPNDLYFKYQWGLHSSTDIDINAPQAWDLLSGSRNVVLGTIDTGVDYLHPDLIKNLWVNSEEVPSNGIDDDHNGYVDDMYGINAITGTGKPYDDNSHGTHVAGIIGAEGNNGFGVSGVMQKTQIIACKFLDASGSGDTASAIECMNYFTALAKRSSNPVKIVASNSSWGGGGYSQAFADAVYEHQRLGILFIAAASNEAQNNDTTDTFPANIHHSNVISVAATDSRNALASFSNHGRHSVHLAAPGVDILSTVPNKRYNYLSGTSMAAPFVTGLAGFLKAKDPSLDWVSLKNLIIAGGEPIAAAQNKTISGRRIRMIDTDGQGALSCSNQTVTSRLLPKGNTYTLRLGQSLKLSMLKINCAKSTQVAISSENVTIRGSLLNDLGLNGDDLAYDGVFNGYFTPIATGSYSLAFPGNDNVSVTVL